MAPAIHFLTLKENGERSPTLSAPRRYYPGFFAALFLILLRTAIGWHFLTEGLEKLDPPTAKPFSAEGYLRASTGPLGEWFRSQVPDVYGLQALERDQNGRPAALKARWEEEFDRFADHYHLTDEQREQSKEALTDAQGKIDAWFNDLGHSQQVEKYEADLRHVLEIQNSPETLRYQKAKTYDERRELESTRREIMASIEEISAPMHEVWIKDLTDEQREQYGPVKTELTSLDWINLSTAWGLTFAGVGLMLGFLTPLAALTGATFARSFLPQHAALAGVARTAQRGGALLAGEQEPGRAPGLPGAGEHAEWSVDRPGCVFLRLDRPAQEAGPGHRATAWE